uniref:Uncharacterized protein LOC111128230 n=1 Tax=Crassostrea virginica TaxID=6565 RepID=A0A8B8DNU6_CRAVI|nr:uncharacterized protein LOC111128230 [Crassostrea virginica]
MCEFDVDTKTETGKIVRYNIKRDLEQTILDDDTGHYMFCCPHYLTENTNRDVVVSDNHAVVVANYRGKHRFSYKGPSSESGIEPRGICTDVLSRILVCDLITHSIQIIDKDGQFLSCLEHPKIYRPYCLCYDLNTHLLWVGSLHSNKVVVYRYITRQLDLKDSTKTCYKDYYFEVPAFPRESEIGFTGSSEEDEWEADLDHWKREEERLKKKKPLNKKEKTQHEYNTFKKTKKKMNKGRLKYIDNMDD